MNHIHKMPHLQFSHRSIWNATDYEWNVGGVVKRAVEIIKRLAYIQIFIDLRHFIMELAL